MRLCQQHLAGAVLKLVAFSATEDTQGFTEECCETCRNMALTDYLVETGFREEAQGDVRRIARAKIVTITPLAPPALFCQII